VSAPLPRAPRTHDVYLTPGGLYASAAPCVMSTLLGSCVAVTLWCPDGKVGAMNHYLLPRHHGRQERSPRHGDSAMAMLLARMEAFACARERLQARVFGGAAVLASAGTGAAALGEQNVAAAWQFLRAQKIRIVEEHVGGSTARRITFDVETGNVDVSTLGGA